MTRRDADLVEALRRTLVARADGLPEGEAPPLPAPPPRRATVRAGVALAGLVFLVAGVLAGVRAWDGWSGGEVRVASVPTTAVPVAGQGTVSVPQLTAPTSAPGTTLAVTAPSAPPVTTAPVTTVPVTTVPGLRVEALPEGGPVPAGFGPRAASFVSPTLGWAVGAAPCAGGYCGAAIRTADGGRTWRKMGEVPANLTMVGFVDGFRGWAMGPQLFATEDGGVTWRPAANPLGERAQATGIHAAGGVAYLEAMADDGVWRLFRATSADPRWVALPELTAGAGPLRAQHVLVGGGSAWLEVVAGTTRLYYLSPNGGETWERRADVPCARDRGARFGVAGPMVVAVCEREDLSSSAGGVHVSTDGGRTFDLTAEQPWAGPVWGVGTAGPGAIVASGPLTAERYFGVLNGSFDGGRTWRQIASAVNGGRFGDIQFFTADRGVMIEDSFPRGSAIWLTDDGGRTWRPVPLP